ncbi:valine--tRNA ligase [Candidatus Kaiserbacteria bacterium]|nr:valine--tRNA ligase [Candidatus Kaiserbacteria bacterium]
MAPDVPEKFLKPYDPTATEGAIYKKWEESGYFNPDNLPGERAEAFTVILPPPNVTGTLHVGHAYEDALQDIVIRFQRMRGKKALWIPGTDSAALPTQARVEKDIQKEEGKSRYDIGRDELVKRVTEFAKNSESTILSQVRRMGASLDWSRYAYTMDEARNTAVFTAFKRMFEAGLIYRGNRIVNWDPKGQTTISDDETLYEERDAKLYTFRYSKDFPIPVATTRLETKVGDTAVAVHPDDERYRQYVGQEYDAVFCDVPVHIKIIADPAVEPEFGTGALGVTPAHSQTDWDIAERHDLPRPQVINEYAKMEVEGRLHGKKTAEARELVAEWLQSEGLLEKVEDIKQNVSTSERTGAIIEPLPKLQWWIDVNKPFTIPYSEIPGVASGSETTLKALMRAAVESGAVDMPQEGFRKTYFHWIDNLRDWCISRQIWFGHRIPVWYRGEESTVSETSPGEEWSQDPDVLDTWFSSALWPFSTLGWPEKTADLETFYPTSFMSPAYEILQLWVSRMILMGTFHLGVVPFNIVFIHGLVRAKDGRKFSKSLNNGVDPLLMIEKYGADALRMGLIVGAPLGSDVKFDEQKIKGYKLFANKLWNITRFVLSQDSTGEIKPELKAEFDTMAQDVTKDLEEYRIYMAAEKLYHYVWDRFAAEILEESKGKPEYGATLYYLLENSLKLLHPFMPFVTEEIWDSMPSKKDLLMVEHWPVA